METTIALQNAAKVFCKTQTNFKSTAFIQKQTFRFSFFNLCLVAALGVCLRSYAFVNHIPFEYKNLLHGHSHFAFGGWVMPVLTALIMATFPELTQKVAYKHWRNISVLLLASAYGMLLSFPVQGYGAVSIVFSTLSVLAGYYLAIVLWKALKNIEQKTSHRLLTAGLFYLAIASIGPFATGPLIAMGKAGTPIYFNAIYFYLHFQYNGWFTFVVLALLYKLLEEKGLDKNGKRIFKMFNAACIPAYFLSILWNGPSLVFNIVGGLAALLQIGGLIYLLKDVAPLLRTKDFFSRLLLLVSIAFAIKNILQLLSAFPTIAHIASMQRGFVIAYLHLVLLGFISLYAFAATIRLYNIQRGIKPGLITFLIAFIVTEILLIAAPIFSNYSITLPYNPQLLLLFSIMLLAGAAMMFNSVRKIA